MRKHIKKAITISIIVVIIIIAIISTFFIVKYFKNMCNINYVCETYSDNSVQDRLDTENISNQDLILKIDNENIIGVIDIQEIGFKGLIYEGTSLDTLSKGVGHFDNTPYINGNVCLAAHNTKNYWSKLYTLQTGDKVTYISFLGTKEYYVDNVSTIEETDWSKLENTTENTLTLITCVKGKPSQRLAVHAISVQ